MHYLRTSLRSIVARNCYRQEIISESTLVVSLVPFHSRDATCDYAFHEVAPATCMLFKSGFRRLQFL